MIDDKKARTLKDQREAEIADTAGSAAQGTVSKRKSGIYWFGAPIKEDGRLRFISDMKSRFPNKPEYAVSHISDITNRIIDKAAGLLQYNAVLLAVTYLISYPAINSRALDFTGKQILSISIICSILSAIIMMIIMFTHWHKCSKDPWKEFEEGARLCMTRSNMITIGLILGGASAILDILLFVLYV